jgi:DNA-binding transcriptional regulator YiaG
MTLGSGPERSETTHQELISLTQPDHSSSGLAGEPIPYGILLRTLREAAGLSRDAWSARIGYGRATVQRWELGETVPDARAEAALAALCSELGLFRSIGSSPLGTTLTPDMLRSALAEARTPSMAPALTLLRPARRAICPPP